MNRKKILFIICVILIFGISSIFFVLSDQNDLKKCSKLLSNIDLASLGFKAEDAPFQLTCVKTFYLSSNDVDVDLFFRLLQKKGYSEPKTPYSFDVKCGFLPDYISRVGKGCFRGDVNVIYDNDTNIVEVVILK